jgi:hypothetical protein
LGAMSPPVVRWRSPYVPLPARGAGGQLTCGRRVPLPSKLHSVSDRSSPLRVAGHNRHDGDPPSATCVRR